MKKRDTEFLPSALEIIETPPSPLGKIIVWLITGIIVCSILWAVLGKIDEVALASGRFIPDGNIKVIQSMQNGMINQIHVKEGQSVKKGDNLIELDSTIILAELERLRIDLETAHLEKELLQALNENNLKKVNNILNENNKKTISDEFINMQIKLINATKNHYDNQVEKYSTDITLAQTQLDVAKSKLNELDTEIEIIKEQYVKTEKLYNSGAISEAEYLKVKNSMALKEEEKKSQLKNINYYKTLIAQNENELNVYSQTNNKDTINRMVEKDKIIMELETEIDKMVKSYELNHIIAPVDGTIHSLSENTIGGVITSAKPILSIIPKDTPLVVEAMALNKDIGFIELGQEVEIKVDAFPFFKYGIVKGKIIFISPDSMLDENIGYIYKVIIEPENDSIKINNKEVKITSGMTTTVEIKLGRKRIIEFFLPAIDYVKDSFKVR